MRCTSTRECLNYWDETVSVLHIPFAEKIGKCVNAKMRKCENAKMRKCENAKMRKCENAKMRKCENVKKKGIVTLAVIGKFAVTFGSHVGGGRGNTTGGKRNEWVPSRPVSECERGEHGMVQ